MKTERELFEEWLARKYSEFNAFDIRFNHETNDYDHIPTRARWEAWQASANRQGYKLVPVEASEPILDAACEIIDSDEAWSLYEVYKAMIGAVE